MNINKKENLPEKSINNTAINSFFDGNHLHIFLYKKAEKLSSAVYMVTNFIPENESLRGLLRDKSISVFSEIAHMQKMSLIQYETSRTNDSVDSKYNSLYLILSYITEILSFLEILHSSGYISEMNFTILRREYVELGELIKNRKDDIATGETHLKDNFFDVPDLYQTYALRHSNPTKESITDTIQKQYQIKDTIQNTKRAQEIQKTKIYPKINKIVNIKHSNRKNIILELLQNKSSITVKDTENAIKECSAKTLQRELLSLVSEGILKKKGERRWSAYSLA
jgi:hypothetical protein